MLLGNFKESKVNIVEMGFPGNIIQAIVEYIHTDACQILKMTTSTTGSSVHTTDVDAESMHAILGLMDAAMYFDLPSLYEKCRKGVISTLKLHPSLAFVVLVKTGEGTPMPQELIDLAVFTVQVNEKVSIPPSAVSSLELSTLKRLLQDDDLRITEFHRFELLRQWRLTSAPEDSWEGVVELEKHIRHDLIHPLQQTTSVAEAGYFSHQRLYEGLKFHATFPFIVDKTFPRQYRRSLPVWKKSNTLTSESERETYYGVDTLEVAPFKSGVCHWSIEVKSLSPTLAWVGVTMPEYDPQRWLGEQSVGWIYAYNGTALHNGKFCEPTEKYKEGSLVTLTLDLRPGDELSGSLHASVDGGTSFLLFSGLCKAMRENQGEGFIPAVSLCKSVRMRLVDLKWLE